MIVVVPDYRHAYPPPIPDGQTVRQPPRPAPAPAPLARWRVLIVAVLVLALMVVGIVTR